MPGVDKLVQTILEEAARDARKTAEEARGRVTALEADFNAGAAAEEARIDAWAGAECAERHRRGNVMAELDMRKARLAARRALIERAFANARAALLALGDEPYAALMAKLALQAAEGGETMVPARGETRVTPALVERINAELIKSGRAPLTLSDERAGIEGGFILRRGGVECNCSVDAVLRASHDRLEGDVAAALFGTEGETHAAG